MTCIVGLEHEGSVWVGGDSAGVSGTQLSDRLDPKVFHVRDYLIGFTASFRLGSLLRYRFKPPKPPERGLERMMATEFVDAVRGCLKEGGLGRVEHSVESGGTFLVGVNGRLFLIDRDYQLGRYRSGYHALGAGARVALGALHVTGELEPKHRIHLALQAAECFTTSVRRPFRILHTRAR
ncbi:MAG: hypothetical protein JRI68_29125 [Deltaproteobacteria bacterium]|nr:hypothetical protein [Deltaproteobacteria bacterium]